MKRLLCITALSLIAAPALAAGVGVSINVNEPGLFGRIDLGGYPPPQTIYQQPVIIDRGPGYAQAPPLYLHVPPGYAQNWRRHCREYDACGQRVYFVQDNWYQQVYAPRYRQNHGGDHRDERRDEHRDDRRGGDQHREGDRGDRREGNDRGRN